MEDMVLACLAACGLLCAVLATWLDLASWSLVVFSFTFLLGAAAVYWHAFTNSSKLRMRALKLPGGAQRDSEVRLGILGVRSAQLVGGSLYRLRLRVCEGAAKDASFFNVLPDPGSEANDTWTTATEASGICGERLEFGHAAATFTPGEGCFSSSSTGYLSILIELQVCSTQDREPMGEKCFQTVLESNFPLLDQAEAPEHNKREQSGEFVIAPLMQAGKLLGAVELTVQTGAWNLNTTCKKFKVSKAASAFGSWPSRQHASEAVHLQCNVDMLKEKLDSSLSQELCTLQKTVYKCAVGTDPVSAVLQAYRGTCSQELSARLLLERSCWQPSISPIIAASPTELKMPTGLPPVIIDWLPSKTLQQSQQDSTTKGISCLVVIVLGHTNTVEELRTLRNELAIVLPGARFLESRIASEWKTEPRSQGLKPDDIDYAAIRLSQEVCAAITEIEEEKQSKLASLSFVGVGIGGIVVRAALSWLCEHWSKLRTCMTLCSPHLGLWPQGLAWSYWLRLSAWQTIRQPPLWLDQLSLSEGRRAIGSRLHRLSDEANGLAHFQRVVFIASSQDSWVPTWSALGGCANFSSECKAESGSQQEGLFALPPQPEPSSKTLLLFFPLMWLMRIRAFSILAAILAVFLIMLVLPAPHGRIGDRIKTLKKGVSNVLEVIRAREKQDLNAIMASKLAQSIQPERLVKVEIAVPRRPLQWLKLPKNSFGSELLQNSELARSLARSHGPLLI